MTTITECKLRFYGAPVTISWQYGDDHRAERLFRVAHFLVLNNALPPHLTRLHDHAGILRLCWRDIPGAALTIRLAFEAWSAEGEQSVWHVFGDDPRVTPFLEDEGASSKAVCPYYRSTQSRADA